MPTPRFASTTLAVLTLSLGIVSLGCNNRLSRSSQFNPSSDRLTQASSSQANSGKSAQSVNRQDDPFLTAVDRATAAYAMSQAAQTTEEWRLVANRWQQAIDFMATVPVSSPRRVQAQQRLAEYQQNLANAKLSASSGQPQGIIAVSSPQNHNKTGSLSPSPFTSPITSPISQPPPSFSHGSRSFIVPIIRREGNTPVIHVKFNGNQHFEMIVDTGASGTLITPSMASTLRIVPVSETRVDTASQRGVSFPMGYVQSMAAGGVEVQNVLVAVASTELRLGLLGHDFFGNYDIIIREHEVEFQERN